MPMPSIAAGDAGASSPPKAAGPFATAGTGKDAPGGGALDIAGVARLRMLAGWQAAAVRSDRGAGRAPRSGPSHGKSRACVLQ